jgi:Domain of unknown function (DUF4136)
MAGRRTSVELHAMVLQKLPALALLAATLAACAAVDQIETSDPAALPAFQTFHIEEEQFTFATDITPEEGERISRQLRAAAVSAFSERGYREVAKADVLVILRAVSRPTLSAEGESGSAGGLHPVDTSVFDPGRPPPMAASELPPSGIGREGDLLLELLDPETRRSLWRARSSGAATTPSEALRKARATYTAMVAKLPRAAQD